MELMLFLLGPECQNEYLIKLLSNFEEHKAKVNQETVLRTEKKKKYSLFISKIKTRAGVSILG